MSTIRDIAHDSDILGGFDENGKDELSALAGLPCAFVEDEAKDEFGALSSLCLEKTTRTRLIQRAERDMQELANPNSLLFAVEPANIYLDPSLNVPSAGYPDSFSRWALPRLSEIVSDPKEAIIRGGPLGPACDRGLSKWAGRLLDAWPALDEEEHSRYASWKEALEYVDQGRQAAICSLADIEEV